MILVVDNYDSFTYNLVQYLQQAGAEVVVRRNDEITLDEISELRPEGIMLSPGPCTPNESGVCVDILGRALRDADPKGPFGVPVFGVCLGHQAIGMVSGATVRRADNVMHGKASMVRHDGQGLFAGMPNPFSAIRYHSLVITRETLSDDYLVTATSEDDHEIMGVRHKTRPVEGVQFHPESVLTQEGFRIVENFVKQVREFAPRPLATA